MSKKEGKDDDPYFINLIQRITRVEEHVSGLDKSFESIQKRFDKLDERVSALEKIVDTIKKRLDTVEQTLSKLDNRTYYILASVILGIIITLATRLL
jgi:chromosome segregation ATPase